MNLFKQVRNFGRFFAPKKGNNKAVHFKTLNQEELAEQGLALQDGLANLPAQMQKRLQSQGVDDLFLVQKSTFHLFAHEQNELIVKSRTGTGKTLAFLLPLEYLLKHSEESKKSRNIRAIILEPTRELATQVQEQVEKFTNLRSTLLYGGVSKERQCKYKDVNNFLDQKMRDTQPELIVATPGRLIDMVNSYNLDLSEVDFFVLDEGDRMLDMGFQDDIVEIQNNLSSEELRSMIFSATVPNFIQKIARDSMESPIMIDLVGDDQAQLPSTLRNMITLAGNQEARMSHIHNFVTANPDLKTLIFTQTKHEARSFSMQKFSKFYPIHGDLSQSEREYALTKFKQPGSGCILVGTDVAARGLDIDDVDVVIQCGCTHVDSFVHRAGRTARRGKSGTNILFLDASELKFAQELEQELNITFELTNQLTPVKEEGQFIEKFETDMHRHNRRNTHVDASKEISQQLEGMRAEEPEKHDDYLRFLIDYYVGKTFQKVEPLGFLSGRPGTKTFGIRGASRAIWPLVDRLKDERMHVRFMKNEENVRSAQLDVIFDVTDRQMAQIKDVIPSGEDIDFSQLDGQLPEWAKTVLLKYSQFKMHNNDRRGGYEGRQRYSGYAKPDYNNRRNQNRGDDRYERRDDRRERSHSRGGFMKKDRY